MSWFSPGAILWRMLLASGYLDQSLLMFVGPSLQVLSWSVTNGYSLYRWCNQPKPPKVIVLEVQTLSSELDKGTEDEFVVISHSAAS